MEAPTQSNLAVVSNIWIDEENPENTSIGSVIRQIPGDLMIDFIAAENPMVNPRDTQLLRDRLTRAQIEEYKMRRFFLNHGELGEAYTPTVLGGTIREFRTALRKGRR